MDGFKGNLVHHLEFAPGFWWLPNLVEEDEFLRVPREGPMPLQWAIVFVVTSHVIRTTRRPKYDYILGTPNN